MKAYRNPAQMPPIRLLKATAGALICKVRPTLAERVAAEPFSGGHGPVGRLVRNALQARALARRDHETLEHFLRDYWSSGEAREFFDHFSHRFETLFLRHHLGIVGELARLVDKPDHGLTRLVELGSGDGRVLHHLREALPQLTECVGLDLNQTEVAACNANLDHRSDLRFEHVTGDGWISRNLVPGTVLFTNGGVLEYVTRERLVSWLTELASCGGPCAAAFTETLAVDHDLDREEASHAYGHEFAFSHNYPAILRGTGFEIEWMRDRPTLPGEEHHPARWLQILATKQYHSQPRRAVSP